MSAYKKLNQQDAYISTYTARKSWIASGSEYKGLGINNIVGYSGSLPYYASPLDNIHGGNYPAENSSDFNRRLIYESTRHLYYSLFQDTDNIATGSYDNFLQSSYDVSGSRFLNERFALFSLPKEMYGTHIEPFSISITPDLTNGTNESGSLDNYVFNNYSTDEEEDPNGTSFETEDNLYIENVEYLFGSTGAGCSLLTPDYIEDESDYVAETAAAGGEYLDITATANDCNEIVDDGEGRLYLKYSVPRYYVGNVIYTHGQLIITDTQIAEYYNNYFDAVLRWKSNLPIFTHNYHCKIKSSEFNYTLNKTSLAKLADGTFNQDGLVETHLTGSDYPPYFTTVGLYNDSNELVAVGKMSSPTPKSLDTDMSVIVQLDMNFGSNRGFDLRQAVFNPFDPQYDIDNPPDLEECVYYFTFRNYYTRSGKSMHIRHSAKVENVHPYPKDIFAQRQTGNGVTLSRDYTQTSPARGTALKMRVNPTTGWNDPHIQTYNNPIYNLAPAEAGETWTMSVFVKADQNTQVQLYLFAAREDGSYISEYPEFQREFNIGTGWERIKLTRTFNDPETAFVQARLDGPNGYYSEPITIWWDGFKVEKNNDYTAFNSQLAKDPIKRNQDDNGDYILFRKRNFTTNICKRSSDGLIDFTTQDFTRVKITDGLNQFTAGTSLSAACYVDVTVTESTNPATGQTTYAYDWTQNREGTPEYNESANEYNRGRGFFINAVQSYLLERGERLTCTFESAATQSCDEGGGGEVA